MKDAAWQHRPDVADAQFADRLTHVLSTAPNVSRRAPKLFTLDRLGLAIIVLALLVLLYL